MSDKTATRQKELLSFIRENGEVRIAQLCQSFNQSESTIRRDLKKLRENNLLMKVGKEKYTLLQTMNSHPRIEKKEASLENLAYSVLNKFNESDIIFIGSGQVNNYLCELLIKCNKSLTLITSNVNHASILRRQNQHGVYLLGGKIRPSTGEVDGALAINMLRDYRLDMAILACNSIIPDKGVILSGFTDYSLIKTVIEQSRKVIVVACKDCFNSTASGAVIPFTSIDAIHTESNNDPVLLDQLIKSGIEIVQV